MPGVEVKGLDEIDRMLNDLLKEFPEERRKLHEEIGKEAFEIVQDQIAATSNSKSKKSGTVRGMQVLVVGSGGGYVAVKPQKGSGADSPGAITMYNENGHRIRRSKGTSKRYRPRINTAFVNGRHFYQKSESLVEAAAIRKAEEFADELAKKIGG